MSAEMVGRPRKFGDAECLSIECRGFGKLGRIRMKKVRGKKGSRYIYHTYFRHNDASIGEHYVKLQTRDVYQNRTDKVLDELNTAVCTIDHGFSRIFKDSKKFKFTEEEKRRWLIANIKLQDDLIIPLKLIALVLNFRHLSAITGKPLPRFIQPIAKEIEGLDVGKSLDTIRAKHPYFDELNYVRIHYQNTVIKERRRRQVESWHNSQDIPKRMLEEPKDLSSVQLRQS